MCRDGEHLQIQVLPHWQGMLPPREAAGLPGSGDGVILRDVRDRLLVLSVKHHPPLSSRTVTAVHSSCNEEIQAK